MARPSMNRTAVIRLSMTPETKARLTEYAVERRSSVSQLVTEWIWSVKLKSDEDSTEVGAK